MEKRYASTLVDALYSHPKVVDAGFNTEKESLVSFLENIEISTSSFAVPVDGCVFFSPIKIRDNMIYEHRLVLDYVLVNSMEKDFKVSWLKKNICLMFEKLDFYQPLLVIERLKEDNSLWLSLSNMHGSQPYSLLARIETFSLENNFKKDFSFPDYCLINPLIILPENQYISNRFEEENIVQLKSVKGSWFCRWKKIA